MTDFLLSDADRKCLLHIARKSICNILSGEKLPDFALSSPVLEQKCGAFVTLEKHGRLRGCIGNIEPEKSLFLTVSEMAIASAFRDPRFPPLREEEFGELSIEISVLSPLKRIKNKEEVVIGKHGILIRKEYSSGLLLPQVARRYGWNEEEFLRQTCAKAGLYQNAWKEADCEIWIFSAVIFREDVSASEEGKAPDNR
jgi:AmmeMemoRadiSam system protein A